MDNRKRIFAATTVFITFLLLIIIFIGAFISRSSVVSPVQEEGVIRILFISPTGDPVATPSAVPSLR